MMFILRKEDEKKSSVNSLTLVNWYARTFNLSVTSVLIFNPQIWRLIEELTFEYTSFSSNYQLISLFIILSVCSGANISFAEEIITQHLSAVIIFLKTTTP